MIKTLIKRSAIAFALISPTAIMAAYPVAIEDSYVVRAGTQMYLEVLNNDTGDELELVESNEWTANGGKTFLQGLDRGKRKRRITYTAPSTVGEDEFWYVMRDGQGRTNAARVKITVKPQDPNALDPRDDTVSVKKDTSIRIDVLGNDNVMVSSGNQNNGLMDSFNEWSQQGGQIKQVNLDQYTPQLEYTPKPGFIGTDEFWYSIKADCNISSYINCSDVPHAAKVTVNVTENNSAGSFPFTRDDNYKVYGASRGFWTIAYYPLDNDSGKNLKIVDRSGRSKEGGTYSVRSDGRLSYLPPAKWTYDRISGGGSPNEEQDVVWYVIEDEVGRTNWGTINFKIPPNYNNNNF